MNWKNKYFKNNILDIPSSSYIKNINISTPLNYYDILKQKEKNFDKNLVKLNELVCKDFDNSYYESINSLDLLKKENDIIKILNKSTLKNNNSNDVFLKKILIYLLNISKILQKRINQKDIINKNSNVIQRCSYKFCKFRENCIYNYKKDNNICYQDHFVHNMVCMDIKELLKCFDTENNFIDKSANISKSINTLNYVINHMEKELSSRCIYCVDSKEIEKEHISKTKK